jgi:isopentenyldiphosphate isomerase
MAEQLEIYSDKGRFLTIKDKNESHKEMMEEFIKKGKISNKHKHSRALLLTSSGKLILQKRSKWKGDNPGLWDKSIGGHTFKNESFDFTIVRECAEELQIPTTVVKKSDFKHAVNLIDLRVMGLIFQLEINKNDISLRKMQNGRIWEEPSITAYYLGYYDGHIRFARGESSGFRVSTLKEIEEEMQQNPKMFTKDIFYIIKKWKYLIKPINEIK